MDAMVNTDHYTIADIYHLPEGKRAELIDGQIYDMAPPGRTHQKISSRIHQAVANYIDSKNGACEVYAAPFAVFLNQDESNYVEPDICVICDTDKLDEKGCHGAPDWVIEIISPASRTMDCYTKLFKYKEAGVREYWIVDPPKEIVLVYRFEKKTMETYSFQEVITAGIYDDFSMSIQI